MSRFLRFSFLAVLVASATACSSSDGAPNDPGGGQSTGGAQGPGGSPASSGGSIASPSTGGTTSAAGGATSATGGTTSATGGATSATGGATSATGGATSATGGNVSTGGVGGASGGASATGGVTGSSGGSIATGGKGGAGGSAPAGSRTRAGVNVHDYPKPTAYGYIAADGKDRMGDALKEAAITLVRAGDIGSTAFLTRLHDFGVKEAVLQLSASAYGKPFDPQAVAASVQKSLTAAKALGITIQVEGLNEWDLFNSRPYNAGVLPANMTNTEFVLFTQRALYDAAHPLGLTVLGPSVGHPQEPASLSFFPDVSPYVDVVNAHVYFGTNPESIPLAQRVKDHQRFQGTGKPFWVTETGVSSYTGVTTSVQADAIRRGLAFFDDSGLVQRAFVYELLESQKPGLSGTTFIPDSAEYHFGLFTYEGAAKPAAASIRDFIAAP